MKRRYVKPLPIDWVIEKHATHNGRHIDPDTEVSIKGERGRFRFVQAVTTDTAFWYDFIGGKKGHECFRSFYPDRIKTVHRIKKTRHNAKGAK